MQCITYYIIKVYQGIARQFFILHESFVSQYGDIWHLFNRETLHGGNTLSHSTHIYNFQKYQFLRFMRQGAPDIKAMTTGLPIRTFLKIRPFAEGQVICTFDICVWNKHCLYPCYGITFKVERAKEINPSCLVSLSRMTRLGLDIYELCFDSQ
jgi:hypothetical protein